MVAENVNKGDVAASKVKSFNELTMKIFKWFTRGLGGCLLVVGLIFAWVDAASRQ